MKILPVLQRDGQDWIYYEFIQGDAHKPVLVFLHEGLGCTGMWKDFPGQLCRTSGCPGLVYDRQGYGRSAALSQSRGIDYIHRYALEELPLVLQAIIPEQPFILIGHSDGGSIALIYGARGDRSMRGIITEAAHVFVEPETIDGIRRAEGAYRQGKMDSLRRYHGDKTDSVLCSWADVWLSRPFRGWDIVSLLAGIECPVLVMQGGDDQYGTVAQVDTITEGVGGRAESIIINDCCHVPHLEQPDFTLSVMADFIQQQGTA